MKKIIGLSLTLTITAALLGCSTTANNAPGGNNANIRGTNTNTGYVTNSESNVKPTIPANSTNITPGNMTGTGNNSTAHTNSNANSNMNKK